MFAFDIRTYSIYAHCRCDAFLTELCVYGACMHLCVCMGYACICVYVWGMHAFVCMYGACMHLCVCMGHACIRVYVWGMHAFVCVYGACMHSCVSQSTMTVQRHGGV